jgi:hypothetical protein
VGAALLFAVIGTGLIAAAGLADGAPSASTAAVPGAPVQGGSGGASSGSSDASVGGRVAISPIVITLELVPRKPKSKGPPELRAIVRNLGAVRVPEVVVSLRASPAALAIRPSDPAVLRNIAGGRSAEATWTLCSTSSATYELLAVAAIGAAEVRSRPLSVSLPASRC